MELELGSLTIPRSHFRDIAWGREVSDGISVLGGGLDGILSDQEPGEVYLPPGKSEFLRVEHQTVLVTECFISSTVSECVMMSSPIFSKSLLDVVDGQSSMMVSVCLV